MHRSDEMIYYFFVKIVLFHDLYLYFKKEIFLELSGHQLPSFLLSKEPLGEMGQ